ncbi:type II toxin-antitoxin system Phd/YefM family antitoxin [Pelomonas sp. KK5]|uniref:type II toxin-antitoxin system Phd/YefM family antitoxin n=1 Tax=Pelomonas sp. KK5 TaxID=1855730 RepID=UPI00097BDAA7|nr:type II toxin-antitoxin system Phd/YefM family antitoxin [Pelomonas sp. KK5]
MALEAIAVDLPLDEHRSARLIPFTRTELAGELPRVSRTVAQQGEVVITAHNKPEMVLMTVERYLALQEAGRPSLDRLSEEFEALYAAMQSGGALDAADQAFAMSGEALGRAAQSAAASTTTHSHSR